MTKDEAALVYGFGSGVIAASTISLVSGGYQMVTTLIVGAIMAVTGFIIAWKMRLR